MKRFSLKFLFLFFLTFSGIILLQQQRLHAQTFSQEDLTQVKSSDLSDAQLRSLIGTYKQSGGALSNLSQYLTGRGMASEEASKIMLRVQNLTNTTTTLIPGSKDTGMAVSTAKTVTEDNFSTKGKGDFINGLPIFGTAFFDNQNASLTPNTNRPTPSNYILGPGDALNINIYGNSVVNWTLNIAPEGFVVLPGMGKVYVGGKTMTHAIEMLKNALKANNYAIGNGTNMDVSLANIRSIQVAINGYVKHPGNYTLSSLSTVFNALYACGGPGKDGSIRAIKLIRNGRLYARVDVYDFLLKGDKSGDIQLHDGDVLQIPVYNSRVSISGEVKRPAYYEMMPGESLQDLVSFAGGFTTEAYTNQIKAVRYTGKEKRIEDIEQGQYNIFSPANGDAYFVSTILDRFENRVVIDGAVFRPGDFELKAGMTLTTLIKNAGGLKEDAFPQRGYITRLNPDNTTQIVPFDVKEQATGEGAMIVLQREDIVTIPSIFDLRDNYSVTIRGMVRQPAIFPFAENMTIKDLILKAGGFSQGANTNRIVIARRIKNDHPDSLQTQQVKIIKLDIDTNFSLKASNLKLQPYDVVSIFSTPGYQQQGYVMLRGEVMYPGNYAILNKTERISDLIKRAGGLTPYAYLKGTTLKRENSKSEQIRSIQNQQLMLRNQQAVTKDTTQKENNNVIINGRNNFKNNYVGINLTKILKSPESKYDLILQDGDEINIPGMTQTVKVSGSILSPTAIVYNNTSLKYYINRGGGFSENALKRKTFVIYANGSQKGTRNFLFFKNYPSIEPGAEIFVPEKRPRAAMSTQAWVSLGTSIASMAALVLAAIRYTK